jgi:hypothetical protein
MRSESIRKATILLIVLAGVAVVSTAAADSRTVNRVEPKLVRVPEPTLVRVPIEDVNELRVRVWTEPGEGALVFPGEDVKVRFRVDEDAYVVVYDVDTMGRVRVLFPEDPYDDGFVRGGQVVRLPGRGAGYRLLVSGPAGVERIVALASDRSLMGRWQRFADSDVIRLDGSLSPRLVKTPVKPNLIPVPVGRGGVARDETWLRVGRTGRRY